MTKNTIDKSKENNTNKPITTGGFGTGMKEGMLVGNMVVSILPNPA